MPLDSFDDPFPSRSIVEHAVCTLAPHVRRTPTVDWSSGTSAAAALKLELLQHAGSFKTRGAYADLLLRDVPHGGVAAAPRGNHAAAVAFAAHRLGMPATIFVPEISSRAKVERIRCVGAQLIIAGQSYAEALAECSA
jgi:threonine dehydratase